MNTQDTPSRKQRRDAGVLQITERDILSLTWIAEQYCCSYNHLRQLLALYSPSEVKDPLSVAYSTSMNAVQRWLDMELIDEPRKVIREITTHIWISRRGLKQLNLPYPYYSPKVSTIRHFYAVNAIRLAIQKFPLSALWISQRLLNLEGTENPLPDAELQISNVPVIGVQVVERPTTPLFIHEESKKLFQFLDRYTRLWYFVHHEALAPLQRVVFQLPQQERERVVFFSLDAKEIALQEKPRSTP